MKRTKGLLLVLDICLLRYHRKDLFLKQQAGCRKPQAYGNIAALWKGKHSLRLSSADFFIFPSLLYLLLELKESEPPISICHRPLKRKEKQQRPWICRCNKSQSPREIVAQCSRLPFSFFCTKICIYIIVLSDL